TLSLFQIGPKLSTNIKKPNDRSILSRSFSQQPVSFILFSLGTHQPRPRQEELGTKQSHSTGAKITHCLKLRRQLDIRAQQDLNTIASCYWAKLLDTHLPRNWTR